MNQQLIEENRKLREQFQKLAPPENTSGATSTPDLDGSMSASDDSDSDTSNEGGEGARDNPAEPHPGSARKDRTFPLKGVFGPGFELETDNEEFQLQFHQEIQVEYRLFDKTGQGTVHDGFFVPRAISGFTGRITKPVEYMISFQRGLGGVELRDAFLNFKYLGDQSMFKLGRYRVPYTYEFYAISNQDLLQPERSLYTINFGGNRELGAMLWGDLFDKRLDYSVGIFNGVRNDFQDVNDDKDIIAFINARPFEKSERFSFLNHFNVGGSLDYGSQNNPLQPQALRTAVNASLGAGSSSAAPAFLVFNNNVIESGIRSLWGLHAAWFYKRMSLIAEWNDGIINYDHVPVVNTFNRVPVPVSGYYVSAGYFLTGEHVTRRTQIEVKRPFDLRHDHFGLGAFELQSRFAAINLGQEVFTGGLADPSLWTSNAYTIDTGLNWYLNSYVKVYFDWQHAVFGNAVYFGRNQFIKTSELFWLRFQLYF